MLMQRSFENLFVFEQHIEKVSRSLLLTQMISIQLEINSSTIFSSRMFLNVSKRDIKDK